VTDEEPYLEDAATAVGVVAVTDEEPTRGWRSP
jgi:hypothetical protein